MLNVFFVTTIVIGIKDSIIIMDEQIEGIVARLREKFKSIMTNADDLPDDQLFDSLESSIQNALTDAGNDFLKAIIPVHRRYMVCKSCNAKRLPLDDALKIIEGFSPAVMQMMALVDVSQSSRRAEEKLFKLCGSAHFSRHHSPLCSVSWQPTAATADATTVCESGSA